MPKAARPIRFHGTRQGWVCREAAWGKRTVLEWLESSLPDETQNALREARGEAPLPAPATASAPSVSLPCAHGAALADARVELVTAFERWRTEQGLAVVPALRAWVGIYEDSGASVSDETRAAIPGVAWNTLQRWRHAFLAHGVTALLPGTGGRSSGIDADPAIRETVEAQITSRYPHVTARQIQRVIAADHPGSPLPSISTIRRWTRRYVREHAYELSAVSDPDGHRGKFLPAFGRADADVTALNQLWELDSTTADVMCVDGRRHALVAAIDIWSRRAKVLVVPTSRATAIAALLRRCLLDWGWPDEIRTDEGADYTSTHLRAAIGNLGSLHSVCRAYAPDQKPFIERFIGTISRDLFTALPGFVGHNVAQAKKLRDRRSFAQRRGTDPVAQFRCEYTPEELQQRIDAWCEDLYAREPHAGLGGETPFARAASWRGERRRIDERGLDVLLAEPASGGGWRTVGTDGLSVEGGVYIAAELGLHMRRKVQVRKDPGDYGRVFVFDADGHFVCVAEDPLRTGIDRQAVASEAKRLAKAEDRKARKHARRLATTAEPEAAIDRVLAAAAADAQRVVAFPVPAELHRTDAMDAAAEAADEADAAPRRKARAESEIDLIKRFHQEGRYG